MLWIIFQALCYTVPSVCTYCKPLHTMTHDTKVSKLHATYIRTHVYMLSTIQ